MQKKEYSITLDGKKITATFSDLAEQANGSVIVKSGDTAVLATAVMSKHERQDIDYFPLVVDYEEKFYAAGLVLGGRFMRREGRPSEEAILTGRIVDRTIRPLFDHALRREVQIIITVLSIDEHNDPDVLAILAASLAIGTSDIPWNGPVGAARIGMKEKGGDIIPNPGYADREDAYLDCLVCGRNGTINMIEAGAREADEEIMADVLERACKSIEKIQAFEEDIIAERGKEKISFPHPETPVEVSDIFEEYIGKKKLTETLFGADSSKQALAELRGRWNETVEEHIGEAYKKQAAAYFDKVTNDVLHEEGILNSRRPDGRAFDEVRSLYAEAGGISNTLHGSGIFYRGGTHVLSVLTLGGPQDSLIIEGMEVRTRKYFMHHYNFPPFSAGETGRVGGMNRRAVGHGALAERALRPVIPPREAFPYTIRLVSESLASNGSTSMASVCASSLALMDGGVPIARPVAGIAMGLLLDEKNKSGTYRILTDIQGPEDHHGDMDFKVAGTREGVTAVQMDVKVHGIPVEILIEAFAGAKRARMHILDTIESHIPGPRAELKESAPRIEVVKIDVDKIGTVIGPSGKMIKKITEETGAELDIDETGNVYITGERDAAARAREFVESITREYKEGDRFEGVVERLFDFGAMVRIGPNAEGLVHISELAPHRVEKVTDVVCLGETVPVVVKNVDEKGRINLSIVKADPAFAEKRGKKVCENISPDQKVGYNRRNGRRHQGKRRP